MVDCSHSQPFPGGLYSDLLLFQASMGRAYGEGVTVLVWVQCASGQLEGYVVLTVFACRDKTQLRGLKQELGWTVKRSGHIALVSRPICSQGNINALHLGIDSHKGPGIWII